MDASIEDISISTMKTPTTLKSSYIAWKGFYGTPETVCAFEEYEYIIKTLNNFDKEFYWCFVIRNIQYGTGVTYMEVARISQAEAKLWPPAPGTKEGKPLPREFNHLFLQLAGSIKLMDQTNLVLKIDSPQK